MHGEHETKRYAPGPEPIFSAAKPKSPPPGTACREGTAPVFDVGRTPQRVQRNDLPPLPAGRGMGSGASCDSGIRWVPLYTNLSIFLLLHTVL
jgi:hypothetical protein